MEKNITPREIALKILYDIDKKDAYVNIALKRHLKNFDGKIVDKALITEIVYGIIKFKLEIDYIIEQFASIKIKKMSLWILNILRMGIYQIIYLDRIPNSAAVNESVKLAKRYGHNGSVRFVNGVLRNIVRNKDNIKFPDKKDDIIQYLKIRYSHPEWMIKKWIERYGIQFTEELCESNNEIAELSVRVSTLKTTPQELREHFEKTGINVKSGRYCSEALIIENTGNIEDLLSFKNGLFQVQDESSMLVSKILDPKPNEFILDVCCAPGGKTSHIAQIMGNSGKVLGWDIHQHKVELVQQMIKRLSITNIDVEHHDATIDIKSLHDKADKVLVDAPCSGLGIIRRKPDIKWNKVNEHLEDLIETQKKILQTSSHYVKRGGYLVYSTCTIQDEENIQVIENFLKENPEFKLESIEEYLNGQLKKETAKDGYIQLFPNIDKIDGFFICKLKRTSIL